MPFRIEDLPDYPSQYGNRAYPNSGTICTHAFDDLNRDTTLVKALDYLRETEGPVSEMELFTICTKDFDDRHKSKEQVTQMRTHLLLKYPDQVHFERKFGHEPNCYFYKTAIPQRTSAALFTFLYNHNGKYVDINQLKDGWKGCLESILELAKVKNITVISDETRNEPVLVMYKSVHGEVKDTEESRDL
ncbi:CYFA0S01e03103g1_1 [Cyberlindnera fabianii]|uniref:CYFA0S01e03103g1_1 n=1 Tax=Cyberlindnera fabianii TaxID=36022 RepID=A0A061AMQ3_CYBFA|nr:CYFA0S01e03103g1_1 [Cyberlindnera fabianii]